MSADADTAAMLAEMGACAHRLGMAFGRAAEAAEDVARKIELFGLFDRAFFSVRVAVALRLRLRREGGHGRASMGLGGRGAQGSETATFKAERLHDPPENETERDDDRPERFTERDRDREAERASLPLLLRTLEGVCADAAALPGPRSPELAAELPTLREILTRARQGAAPATPAARPETPSAVALRSRLAGSATAALQPLTVAAPRLTSAATPKLRPRPATGPPRR